MQTGHTLVHGDARRLERVSDEAVHLVVTSPPYWQLKDYGTAEQIGFHDSYEEYINNLNLAWNECVRVLAPGGRLCVNIGDQFARSAYYGRYKVIPIRTEIIRFLETAGLDHMGAIIWRKVTTCNTSGGATVMGSFPYPPNGVVKLDYEFILLFRKPGRRPGRPSPAVREASRLSTEEWNTCFSGHWSFPGVRQGHHLATFPEELPRRLIRMFTFVGDTVLDPFAGSGTTSVAALQQDRSSVGYEVNRTFVEAALVRVREARTLLTRAEVSLVRDPLPARVDPGLLPYRFRDPVRIDRPRSGLRRYGSRIDGSEEVQPRGERVVEVPAYDRVRLESGREVPLLGVGPAVEEPEQVRARLAELCLGRRVSLAADPTFDGEADPPPHYVILGNRTCLNTRLVRSGLVAPDRRHRYRRRGRYERYAREAGAS